MKQLVRSKQDRILAGVAAGFAHYFNVDVAMTRIVWALVITFTGFFPGFVAYIICWAIMPEED